MDPVRELPYGPAALRQRKQAGQMAASDYRQDPILLLHLLGRPQMDCCRRHFHLNRRSAIFQISNVELEASELLVRCQLRRDPRCHKSLFEDFAVW